MTVLAACNKDNEDIQPTQNGYTGPKRLASITSISYSQSYNNYNPETCEYELSSTNGNKNAATLRWSSEGLLLGMTMDGFQGDLLTIEYEGNKMKKVVINAAAMGASEDITYTCSYTGDNLTQLYASMPGQGWTMATFTYSPNGELLTTREESSNGEITATTLVWGNGNVTHVEQTSTNSHTSTTYNYTYDYLYDNMNSAYTGMEMYALFGGYYMLSRNNVLRIIEKRSSTYDSPEDSHSDTTIFTYTYDGDWPKSFSNSSNYNYSYGGGYRSENTNYLRYTDGSGASVPQTFTISVTSNMPDSAAVGIYVYGSGEYAAGKPVVIGAECYQTDISFRCWNDGVTDNPRTITATGDAQFIAVFGSTNDK